MTRDLSHTALLVIDLQTGFDDPYWGPRNNPECEANIVALVSAWKAAGRPVVYVRHDSVNPQSPLRPELPGNALRPELPGDPDVLVTKNVSSAFFGEPDLHGWLRDREVTGVAITGVQTNFCCETTARMAGNLGYDTLFVLDATHTFDLPAYGGGVIPADELARVTATNLQDEFAEVVLTKELM
jgi:nicotinamidase-related amidase